MMTLMKKMIKKINCKEKDCKKKKEEKKEQNNKSEDVAEEHEKDIVIKSTMKSEDKVKLR